MLSKREHPALQNMKFLIFFLLLWVIFAILDPDPDSKYGTNPDPRTRLNPDPIRIRIRIRNPGISITVGVALLDCCV